jgi:hypothetical protein
MTWGGGYPATIQAAGGHGQTAPVSPSRPARGYVRLVALCASRPRRTVVVPSIRCSARC